MLGLVGEVLDLGGDDGETAARFAGARRLDGGVQRQQASAWHRAPAIEFAAQVMGTDTGFHADQARRYIGKPRVHLATRPLLPEHDGATRIVAYDVERVLAAINADHGDAAPNLWVHVLDNFILTSPASSNYPVWTVTLARPWARP